MSNPRATFPGNDGGVYATRPAVSPVGDLRLEARYKPDSATPPATVYLLTNLDGATGFMLYHATSGVMVARYGDGASNRGESDPAMNPVAGEWHTYAVAYDVSAGVVTWELDGVDVATDYCAAAPGVPSAEAVNIGQRITGDLEHARVWEDGDLIVDFSAAQLLEAVN